MKRKRSLAVFGIICLVLTMTALPFRAECAGPIKLKAVTFLPDFVEGVDAFFMLRDLVNERAKGELVIEYLGSGEVLKEFEQGPAVHRGVVDIAWLPSAYYAGLAPGVKALAYSQLTAAEERVSGAYDYIKALHEKGGLYFVGRGVPCKEEFFYIFLNKNIKTPRELAGLKIFDGMTDAFLKKLGSVPVEVEFGEVYTAMERGTIDGWTFQLPGISGFGWHEVTKYWIDHPFYMQDIMTIMNLKKWNSLPKHLQNIFIEAQKQIEKDYLPIWAKHEANERQKMLKAGMKPLTFSPADAKWYVETAYSAAWEAEIKKHPDIAPKLRQLMSK